jgi:hypothetical protein
VFLALAFTAGSVSSAYAYRPFDSTDPAVADLGDFEIELSPLSYRHEPSGGLLIAPQLRLNYGFAEDWEVVLEGQGEHPQFAGASSALVENALSLKSVLREGSLQDKEGPSIAIEIGMLLPGVKAENGVGASLAGIIGQNFPGARFISTRRGNCRAITAARFSWEPSGGPSSWTVRPGGGIGLSARVRFERRGRGARGRDLAGEGPSRVRLCGPSGEREQRAPKRKSAPG